MRVPLSWLREWVAVEAGAAEIAERLTFSGTEVEEIDLVGSPGDRVVVAEVTRVTPHPKDPALKVCSVNDGHRQDVRVVCGAPCVEVGRRYFLARAGGRLPSGRSVQVREIGGVRSEGLLCAEDELGLSDDHSGLVEVDSRYAPGTGFGEVFPPEAVFKLEITPNRGDCLSVLGIARELSALFGVPLSRPGAMVTESDPPAEHFIRVRIEDAEGCARYTARVLRGVRVGKSPLWMRRRLLLSGFRPVNSMVDITNYVLMECGHPLHAFDLDRLQGGEIAVRRARARERIITIDGAERELDGEVLVIADGRGPVAVAGIMGGKETEIRPSTARVLLESAGFDPVRIRRGSKRLSLASESSYRFERGVDVQAVEWASRRAAYLAQRICGAAVARSVVDCFPGRRAPAVLDCRCERVRALTGMEIGDDRIAGVLQSLGLEVKPVCSGCLQVIVPSFRADLTREADLIEEVARIHGLEHIPTRDPSIPWVGSGASAFSRMEKLRRALVGLGLQEAMNSSLTAESLLDELDPERSSRRVRLKNPLSCEQAVLRTSLLPQLLESVTLNASRQIEGGALFELGRVFFTSEKGGVAEEESLGVGLW
ncbi:MAG TPA: phenylalanine--tRNA ligase subunit beta, partial [Kiritimatiellae bacterium]|nr:phenylalanine--tRNA ligase subunit beta [Kiritimatiellia bacterium]